MKTLISIDEIKSTILNENVDDKYILDAIFSVQSLQLQELIGSKLLNTLLNGLELNEEGESIFTLDDNYYNLISSIDKHDRFLNVSIKDNLNIIKENFEEIIHICQKLGIHDEIIKLKYGYDTILNSPNDSLKENTKVLLNIARILLKNTRIMIFDEVLCSLNNESRTKVLKILEEIKENHTIIIIDRNLEVLQNADNIIFIDSGNIISTGKHLELLENKLYKSIVES